MDTADVPPLCCLLRMTDPRCLLRLESRLQLSHPVLGPRATSWLERTIFPCVLVYSLLMPLIQEVKAAERSPQDGHCLALNLSFLPYLWVFLAA